MEDLPIIVGRPEKSLKQQHKKVFVILQQW